MGGGTAALPLPTFGAGGGGNSARATRGPAQPDFDMISATVLATTSTASFSVPRC